MDLPAFQMLGERVDIIDADAPAAIRMLFGVVDDIFADSHGKIRHRADRDRLQFVESDHLQVGPQYIRRI